MSQPELAPIAFLTAFSLCIPLPWHWRNGNVATLSMFVWLFALNMIYAVDAVLWADDVIIRASVWCDITTKIIIGGSIALPIAGLCVCIRLYKASAARGKPNNMPQRRLQIHEGLACYGIPVVFMGLHFTVQGHRFTILETFGCRPTTYSSAVGFAVIYLPPVLISLVALVFAVIALVNLTRHYRSFVTNMRDADVTNFQLSHYIRLMIMAFVQIFWVTSVTAFSLAFNLIIARSHGVHALRPYISWAYVHWHFTAIWTEPRMLMPEVTYWGSYASWYCVPASTWIFVALFAFGEDAVVEYRKCFSWIHQHCGFAFIYKNCIPERWQNQSSLGSSGFLSSLRFNRPKTTQNTSVNIPTVRSTDLSSHNSEEDLTETAKDKFKKVEEEQEIC